MELCTSSAISNLPQRRLFALRSSPQPFMASLPPKKTTISYRNSGLQLVSFPLPRATTSEETSTSIDEKSRDTPDGVITMEEAPETERRGSYEAMPSEASEEAPTGEQMQIVELFDNLNLDSEDTYPLVLYGSGALVVLWLLSALIGAIDSIPLFPKLLEVVGLGYTVWFSSRYLIFKKNRDEFFAKIEELKQEILGSTSD